MQVKLKHMDVIITKEQTEYRFLPGQGTNKDFISWRISFDKKFGRHIRSGVKSWMTLRFKTKSSVTLILALLLVSGDVCPDPGPPIFLVDVVKRLFENIKREYAVTHVTYGFMQTRNVGPLI